MALLFIDSFDHYVTADILEKWTLLSGLTISAGNGRRSSASMRGTLNSWVEKSLSPGDATFVTGFAFRVTALGDSRILVIGDATVDHISMNLKSDGTLEVRRGNAAGTILGTTSSGITANAHHYIEIKGLIDDSTGTIEVRLNGSSTPVLTLTSQDTRNGGTAAWTRVRLGNGNNIGTADYDDLYVLDGSGSAPLNTFLGDMRVDTHVPNANGSNSGSTPSTGTDRYATVDESAPNDDTDYNTLAAVNDKDTLNVQNLASAGSTIRGVQVLIAAKKTDAGAGSACPVVRHSSTDYDGTGVALTTTYGYVREVYATNPGTSAAWTETDFNNAEFGYKRTA
jgi:hypothetical protein